MNCSDRRYGTPSELLSHVTIGANNNAVTIQESRPHAFLAFLFAVQGYLHSKANYIAIWRELCKHHV